MYKWKESIVPGWQQQDGVYTKPDVVQGYHFVPWGFDEKCEEALDMYGWAGFDCWVDVPQAGEIISTAIVSSSVSVSLIIVTGISSPLCASSTSQAS